MGIRLTDRIVRTLPPPPAGNQITYDTGVLGFGARITAGGARAFILNYRVKSTGLARRCTIGSFPDWSVSAAREKAKELKREIDSGGDPLGQLKADRDAPTVADLCARFKEEHLQKLRPKTQGDYRLIIDNELVPALGKLKVAGVAFMPIARLPYSQRCSPWRSNGSCARIIRARASSASESMRASAT
jgi:Arm DNA-binding domain